MSISVPISYLYNRNDKFEVFLRRCLTQEQFERIRGYERCIVCDGKKLNKAFCFFVISDKSIIITQNPPKTILLNILLTSLTNCEIIGDYPDFLDANLTALSTHVQIRYRASASENNSTGENAHDNENTTTSQTADSNANNGRRRSRRKSQLLSGLTGSELVDQNAQSTSPTPNEIEEPKKNKLADFFSKLKGKKANNNEEGGSEVVSAKKSGNKSVEPAKASHDIDAKNIIVADDDEIFPTDDGMNFVSEEEAKLRAKQKGKKKGHPDECVLDVHFLTNITPICLLTKISWKNCLISSTLAKEQLFTEMMVESRQMMVEFEHIDSILKHFDLLMRQLVSSIKAANLNEYVKMAAKFDNFAYHSYALRRTFWRSPANVHALATCAAQFANEIGLANVAARQQNVFQNLWHKAIFELRIESLALTLHLLATFFNETEILSSRTSILEESKNNVVALLINTLCDAVAYTTRRLFFDKGRTHEHQPRTRTEELFEKLLIASAALAYEIILSGQALVHPTESAHFYNVSWIVEQFEKSKNAADAIYGLAYDSMLSVASIPTVKAMSSAPIDSAAIARAFLNNNNNNNNAGGVGAGLLTIVAEEPPTPFIGPARAVQTYRQLFILDILTSNSTVFLDILRQRLTEEFKYFVNMDIAAARVRNDYEIKSFLLNTLETVRHRVIHRPPFAKVQTAEALTLNAKAQKGH